MNQKKVKFNIVDIIVILILVAGIAFVGVRMFGSQQPAEDLTTGSSYRVTFYAECVPESVAATLVQGSACEDSERTMDLGKLVEFSIGEAVTYSTDRDGDWVQTTKPGHVSVTFVCELTGTEMPTGLRLGKYMLNVGHEMGVCCGMTELQAVICGIAPASAE